MTEEAKSRRPRRKSAIDRSAYRSYDEALKWSRSLGLADRAEWKAFCAEGKCPKDVPQKPNKIYKEWLNYAVWLGTQDQKLIMAAERAVEVVNVLYLYTLSSRAPNVIYVGTASGTKEELLSLEIPAADGRISLVRCFVAEPGIEQFVAGQIGRHVAGGATPTELLEKPFVINNLTSLFFELDMVLLPYRFS